MDAEENGDDGHEGAEANEAAKKELQVGKQMMLIDGNKFDE